MRSRKILSGFIVAFFAFSMIGCANSKNDTSDVLSDETVSLNVWGGEKDGDLLVQLVESFKKEYNDQAKFDIKIDFVSESNSAAKILDDVNSAPDVFTFVDDQMAVLSASGVLEPVSNGDEISKRNIEGSVQAASVNNKLFAYPLTADNGYFLYYNKKFLSEQDVLSLDSILNVADSNNKQITMDLSSGWYLYSFFGNSGLKLNLNDDGVTNYCNWNGNEGGISGLDIAKYLNNMVKRNGFKSSGDDSLVSGLKDESVIAGVSGVWIASDVEGILGENYGAVKLPTYNVNGKQIQMASFSGYKMLGVNAYSKNKAWAEKLADWITNEENQVLRFNMRGQGPSNSNAAKSKEISKSLAINAVLAQQEYAQLQRVGVNYWDPVNAFGKKIASKNTSDAELQEMVDKMVNGITASIIKKN